MLAIKLHLELMLLDLEKCSIKNSWRDKPEKAESVQLEKNFSPNVSMKLSDKLLLENQKEVFCYWE